MAALVSLDDAKAYLRILGTDFDAELTLKAQLATDIVVDYLKTPDHGWTEETVPDIIKAAICEVLRNMIAGEDPLPQRIRDLLGLNRDPALA